MVSKRIQKALLGNSAIRAMFVEGKAMAEKYGAENVYDFSLGNPATPAPATLNDSIRDLLDEADKKGAAGSLECTDIWKMQVIKMCVRRSRQT